MKQRPTSYAGMYVALDPRDGQKIIAYGRRSDRVAAEARRAGVEVPVIVYIPQTDTGRLA